MMNGSVPTPPNMGCDEMHDSTLDTPDERDEVDALVAALPSRSMGDAQNYRERRAQIELDTAYCPELAHRAFGDTPYQLAIEMQRVDRAQRDALRKAAADYGGISLAANGG
jgi:hypothetical protein